jgi:hypothetical protein
MYGDSCNQCSQAQTVSDIAVAEAHLSEFVSSHSLKVIPIQRDGDCWANALHYQLPHMGVAQIRQLVSDYLINNFTEFIDAFVFESKGKRRFNKVNSFKAEAKKIRLQGFWNSARSNIGDFLLPAASLALGTKITVYRSNKTVTVITGNDEIMSPPFINLGLIDLIGKEHYHSLASVVSSPVS